MIIGAQLYTVREACKTLDGLEESLKKVADIGYTDVQLSGICDYDADWMAEKLKENGLTAHITHFKYDKIVKDTENTIRFHKAMNCPCVGLGSIPDFKKKNCSLDVYEEFVKAISPAVRQISDAGLKFMYHNHNMEFIRTGGKNLLERLCEDFPNAGGFGITLDTYWVVAGGGDPVQWLYRLKGRTACVHFKDMNMKYDPEAKAMAPVMVPIGEGNMNYEKIVEACVETGVQYGYVEQDRCNGENPFDCLRRSYAYFRGLGLH